MGGAKKEVKKSLVDHTYRDYSQVEITDLVGDFKGVNEELFPSKLHTILSTPEYSHIITWRPHGRAWVVVNKSLFVSAVLPTYFNHSNFESFNRSVNGWGFKRLLRDGPDQKSYYHEMFLRGKPDLTSLMSRLVSPGKRLPNKAGEPDFYAISMKYPIPQFHVAEAKAGSRRTPSPIYTPTPATKRFRLSHSPQGGHHSYGYHRSHVPQPSPYADHPHHYSQHPLYARRIPPYSEPPPYSRHPPYPQPPPPPNYNPQTTYSPHPYHPPLSRAPQTATSLRGPPNVLYHQHPWGPSPGMPPHGWQLPSSPSYYHYHYRPTAHANVQLHEELSPPEKMMPILVHTNQEQGGYAPHTRGQAPQTHHSFAEHVIDERKPAAQDIASKPDQDTASPLNSSPSQFFDEGLELHYLTTKTLYNEEVVADTIPEPEKLSVYDFKAPEIDEQAGHNVGKEQHNPLDPDNFYEAPTRGYSTQEWVVYPSQERNEEMGEGGGAPEPTY